MVPIDFEHWVLFLVDELKQKIAVSTFIYQMLFFVQTWYLLPVFENKPYTFDVLYDDHLKMDGKNYSRKGPPGKKIQYYIGKYLLDIKLLHLPVK